MSDARSTPTIRLLEILADPIDRAIIRELRRAEQTVGSLVNALSWTTDNTIRQHRQSLADLGIIEERESRDTDRIKTISLTSALGLKLLEALELGDRCLSHWLGNGEELPADRREEAGDALLAAWAYGIFDQTATQPRTVAAMVRASRFTHYEISARVKKLERLGFMRQVGQTNRGPLYSPTNACRGMMGFLATVVYLETRYLAEPGFKLTPEMTISGMLFAAPVLRLPESAEGAVEIVIKSRQGQGESPSIAHLSGIIHAGRAVCGARLPYREALKARHRESTSIDDSDTGESRSVPSYSRPTCWLMTDPLSCLETLVRDDPTVIDPDGDYGGELIEAIRAEFRRQLFPPSRTA